MSAFRWITCTSCLWAGLALAGSPEALTLDDAVSAATQTAPQMQASRAAVDSAASAAVASGRLPPPELVAGFENVPANGADAWNLDREAMTMRKIGILQSFGNARRREAERSLAEAHATSAASGAGQTRLEVSTATAQAWIKVYATEQTVRALEALKPNYALQVRLARDALAADRASAADVLEAQSGEADLDDRLLIARQNVVVARAELTRWVGQLADQVLAAPPAFDVLPTNATALLASVHQHAELRALDARIGEARAAEALAAADRRPDWSAGLAYAQRGPGYSNMVSVEVRVSLPLFAATRIDPLVKARHATVRQLESDRQSAFQMHSAELAAMLAEWRTGRDRAALYEQQRLPLAQQRTAAALAALGAGTTGVRATLSALRDQLNLETDFAQILESYGRAWAYLKYLLTGSSAP